MAVALKQKILSGFFWQGLERFFNRGISFLIAVVLARLLMPQDFGVLALIMVIISLCNVIVDSGLGVGLIQKKELTDDDCCAVFFLNILVSIFLYGCLYLLAPWVEAYYKSPRLGLYLRWSALSILIGAMSIVHYALLARDMRFKLGCKIKTITALVAGAAGILMAYFNCGIWALIIQNLLSAFLTTLLAFCYIKWYPKIKFNWRGISKLYNYSWKLLCTNIVNEIHGNIYSIILSKNFSFQTLAYYNRGSSLPHVGMALVTSTLGNVLFPAFSSIQGDLENTKNIAKKTLKCIMFWVVPGLTILFILARPIILFLLTEKWCDATIFLQLSCFIFIFTPVHTINLQVIMANGRTGTLLVLESLNKIQSILLILLAIPYGAVSIVAMGIISNFLFAVENSFSCYKIIGYSPFKQFMDIFPYIAIAALAALPAYFLYHFINGTMLQLMIVTFVFSLVYLGLSLLFKMIPSEIKAILPGNKFFCKAN